MKFSIVIPNFNGYTLLKKHLPNVLSAAGNSEVIVVDDASQDESVKLIQTRFPQIKLIKHNKNRRYAKTCNSGVEAAKGKIIVLLNNDVSPEKDFLKLIPDHFKDQQVFAVGFLEKSSEGDRGKSTGFFKRGLLEHEKATNLKAGRTLWAFGASAAFDKSKWLDLEGMDELFRPAYWEDIDLSWRAWKKGWEVRFEPGSIVHHEPESTNKKVFSKSKMKQISTKNQLLFVWKNIHDPSLILSHLLWMPIRITSALLGRDVEFLDGSLRAVFQLPEAIGKRQKAKTETQISDKQVLNKFT